MTTFDYQHTYNTFSWLVSRAADWTHDMRGLNANAKYVWGALLKLKNYDQWDHSVPMTLSQRDNIVGCLQTIHWAASQTDYNSQILAAEAENILAALNILFVKEGLDPVTDLYKK